jgi:hypothetical protein
MENTSTYQDDGAKKNLKVGEVAKEHKMERGICLGNAPYLARNTARKSLHTHSAVPLSTGRRNRSPGFLQWIGT